MYKIILFGVDGCPDCDKQKEIIADNFNGADVKHIDLDSCDIGHQELMAKYSISDPPSILVVCRNEEGKSRTFKHKGIISASKLKKFIDKFEEK
jgi:hypothetical protein